MKASFEYRKGLLFVRLKGILNRETGLDLNKKLNDFIFKNGVKYFVINLENLDFADEDGLAILKRKYKDLLIHDGKLLICNNQNSFIQEEVTEQFKDCYQIKNELDAFKLIMV